MTRVNSDHMGQEKATMEIAGCGDHDLHKDDFDLNKTGTYSEI